MQNTSKIGIANEKILYSAVFIPHSALACRLFLQMRAEALANQVVHYSNSQFHNSRHKLGYSRINKKMQFYNFHQHECLSVVLHSLVFTGPVLTVNPGNRNGFCGS